MRFTKKTATILALVFVLIFCISIFAACNEEEQAAPEISPLLKTDGTNLVVAETNETIVLKGTNIGGWLVREGWMCPMNMPSGDYYDLGAYELLTSRFGADKAQELFDVYMDNWFTVYDLDKIKKMGFNCIRVSFGWWNMYDLSTKELLPDAFERLDWLATACAERKLYYILDLHGAFGSQNGQHHSGEIHEASLFTSEDNKNRTVDLWEAVATRYKDQAWFVGYDLLNEPEGGLRTGNTGTVQFEFYDVLYKAIRAIDPNHIIIMEACWEPHHLPNPSKYGWQNVLYEIHVYNWEHLNQSTELFWSNKNGYFALVNALEFNVPWLIGEINCFDLKEDWDVGLGYLDENGYSWTTWSYKAISNGYTSWGLYYGGEGLRADLATDSFEDIKSKFESVDTDGDHFTFNGTLYSYLSVKTAV